MRRLSQSLVFMSLTFLLVVLFQNCGSYQPQSNPLYGDDLSSTCIGYTCSTDREAVLLTIANDNPIFVKKPGSGATSCDATNCVDVSGYCDAAGFPNSEIVIELRGNSGFAERLTGAKCDSLGRFRVLVPLPSGYDYDSFHTLVVALVVQDEQGQWHENPSGRHRKEITVQGASI